MDDEPYRTSDLLLPGFDPFEAHRAWLDRRKRGEPEPPREPEPRGPVVVIPERNTMNEWQEALLEARTKNASDVRKALDKAN